jgi:hypothetical protein
MEAMLTAALPLTHAQAQAHTERRLDRPDEVREQVQAALRQAEHDRTAKERADQAKADHETLASRVKALEETRPGTGVVRAVERFMGWAGPDGG